MAKNQKLRTQSLNQTAALANNPKKKKKSKHPFHINKKIKIQKYEISCSNFGQNPKIQKNPKNRPINNNKKIKKKDPKITLTWMAQKTKIQSPGVPYIQAIGDLGGGRFFANPKTHKKKILSKPLKITKNSTMGAQWLDFDDCLESFGHQFFIKIVTTETS